MSRIRREGGRCFACGAAGARAMMVGQPSIAFLLCPACARAKDAREPHEGVPGGRNPERCSVWSAPPAPYPVCRTPAEFRALAERLIGPERAEVALAPPSPWEMPAQCSEPGCHGAAYKRSRHCIRHYWDRLRERASA